MHLVPEPWLSGVTMPRPVLAKASYEGDEAEFYGRALTALTDAGVPFLIGGAVALNHHTGIWRNTKDLDLMVPPEEVERALAELERLGCEVEVVDAVWLSKAHYKEGGLYVDLIHCNSNGTFPVDASFFERAGATRLLGVDVPVMSAEDLLLSKMFVGSRDRWDGADVLHLLYATKGALDWDTVLARAEPHWELLFSHLVLFRYAYPQAKGMVPQRVWDTLTSRWGGSLDGHGTPAGAGTHEFRGSLLDPVSFQVDVEGWGLQEARQRLRAQAPRGGGRYT